MPSVALRLVTRARHAAFRGLFAPWLLAGGCATGGALTDDSLSQARDSATPGSGGDRGAGASAGAGAATPSGGGASMAGGASGSRGAGAGAGRSSGGSGGSVSRDAGPSGGSSPDASTGGSGAGGGSAGGAGTGGVGAGGSASTPTFGGVYNVADAKCGNGTCYVASKAAASCVCPSGFSGIGPISFLDDRSCPSTNPPYGWTALYACYAGPFTATSDFGGAYHREGTTCHVPNPETGGCTCPTGSQAIELLVDHSCWHDTQIGFCWNGATPLTTFGGVYQLRDDTGSGVTCLVPNPATSACSCPSGTSATEIRDVYGPGDANCKKTGATPGHLYVCSP